MTPVTAVRLGDLRPTSPENCRGQPFRPRCEIHAERFTRSYCCATICGDQFGRKARGKVAFDRERATGNCLQYAALA